VIPPKRASRAAPQGARRPRGGPSVAGDPPEVRFARRPQGGAATSGRPFGRRCGPYACLRAIDLRSGRKCGAGVSPP